MRFEIKHRYNGSVLFSIETATFRLAVEAAVKSGADLSSADLSGAYLSSAYLSGADLSGANLRSANLRSANLSGANLRSADLSGANLRSANLSGANLRSADLSGANLSSADLSFAYLSSADLSGANLRSADLSGADLSSAEGAEFAIACTRILPEGDLIGWKKVSTPEGYGVAKLRIPADAKRSHAFGRKCRAEFVDVLEAPEGAYTDAHGPRTHYTVGQRVTPDKWCENWQEECSNGIHFFITKLEAEDYV